MAKLVFNYGAMGSSKTANALMVAYNYEERGQHALILKPATDTRDGIHTVSSRIGLSNTCRLIDEFLDEFTKNPDCVLNYNAIIVDEAQFASPEQIDLFSDIVDICLCQRLAICIFPKSPTIPNILKCSQSAIY